MPSSSATLGQLVYDPAHFFATHHDEEAHVESVLTTIVRIAAVTHLVTTVAWTGSVTTFSIIVSGGVLVLARLVAMLTLAIGGRLLAATVRMLSNKYDREAAVRVIGYAAVATIIPSISWLAIISATAWCVLAVTGIVQQFHISVGKAIVAVIGPVLILEGVVFGLGVVLG